MLAGQNKQLGNMVVYLVVSFASSTCEHCSSTSSLNLRNPSWILGWLKGNDRKCVKGCFLRKLSTRTSTRVTADETAALLGAVITVSNKRRWGEWIEFMWWWWQLWWRRWLYPHLSVLPPLVSGCWWMSLCRTQDAYVSPPFSQWCICGEVMPKTSSKHSYGKITHNKVYI